MRLVLIRAGVKCFIPAVLFLLGLQGLAAAGPPGDPFPDPAHKPKLAETPPGPGELAVRRVAAAMRSRPDYPATESAVEFALYLYAVSRDEADLEMAGRLARKLEGEAPGVERARSLLARAGGAIDKAAGSGFWAPRLDMEIPPVRAPLTDHLEALGVLIEAAMFSGSPEVMARTAVLAETVVERYQDPDSDRLKASVLQNCLAARSLWEVGYVTGRDPLKKKATAILTAVLGEALESDTIAPAAALAAARQETYPVQMVLIGSRDDAVLRELREASYRLFEPRKLILNLDPVADATRLKELFYPAELAPVLFICVESICSPPIKTADGLKTRVREILDVASEIRE